MEDHQDRTRNFREGVLSSITGEPISRDDISAFFHQSYDTTMVYVGDRQYNVHLPESKLLELLGGDEVFTEIGCSGSMGSRPIRVRRDAVTDIKGGSQTEVFVRGRQAPIARFDWQFPVDKLYKQLGLVD